jgi:hypothetical protein
MALHRDIYWIGKQWAVTGYGVQACDQKQKGKFDIEASRLWEDSALQNLRGQKWLNIEDFAKALSIARSRHPELPGKPALSQQSTLGLEDGEPAERPKPKPQNAAVQEFHMRIEDCRAKFVSQWRIRVRR